MWGIYEVLRWDDLWWRDIDANFHDNLMTSTVWEAAVLVLPMWGIYEVRRWDGLWWHGIDVKFRDDRFRHSSNIKLMTSKICKAVMLVLLMGGIYELYIEMCSDSLIYIPMFIKIGSAIQKLIRGIHKQTHTQTARWSHKPTLIFSKYGK
jgi:hypothetical protein